MIILSIQKRNILKTIIKKEITKPLKQFILLMVTKDQNERYIQEGLSGPT